jgi:hypothetical protein
VERRRATGALARLNGVEKPYTIHPSSRALLFAASHARVRSR